MTDGQKLALEQLHEIASAGSELEIIAVKDPQDETTPLIVDVSLFCGDIEHRPGGLPLRSRERFRISVPAGFPFEYPSVRTRHTRTHDFQTEMLYPSATHRH